MPPAPVPGAKYFAWTWLLMLWNIGGLLGGYMGYWRVLVSQVTTAVQAVAAGKGLTAAVITWTYYEGRVMLLTTIMATVLYKFAYTALSWRDSRVRRISLVSLILFPLLNAVGEGFLLLTCFDLGRWFLGNEKASARVVRWQPAVPALGRFRLSEDVFWQEFIMGAVPFVLANALLLLHFWQGLVLPVHAPPDALRHITSLALLLQFGSMAVYYMGGDILTYIALLWLANVLTVIAVRLPPPGSEPPPPAKQKAN